MSIAWFIIIWLKSATVPEKKQHGMVIDQSPAQEIVALDFHAL